MSLSLRTAITLVPQDVRPCVFHPGIAEFNRDLLAPWGVNFAEDLARPGRNIDFGTLAARLVDTAPDPLPPPDLLILAYALPDPHSIEATAASQLNHALGGGARSFAISEQGLGAPFTALRIAEAYARAGRAQSLALFVLEQVTFPWPEPLAQQGRLVDSGVLLLFGAAGTWAVAGLHAVGPGTSLCDLLAVIVRRAGAPALLVPGPWVAPGQIPESGSSCHRVPPGSYCTSVWLEFARHREDWAAAYRTVVLFDTDPRLGTSHVAVLTRTERSAADALPGGEEQYP